MIHLKNIVRYCSLLGVLIVNSVASGTYSEITDFSDHPENIKMFLYIPDNVAVNPPVLVALHWCSGSAQAIYASNSFQPLADRYGFIIIFPDANSTDGCWDVHSEEVLTHDGGGDSRGIVKMVEYVIEHYDADSSRVFASGISSGAMMTNVLLGAYPDVFKAGAAFAGVPFGCFAGPNRWNGECSQGNLIQTAQEWGDLVRAAFPGYTGGRPRIQMWHGENDEGLHFNNFGEAIKQWTNVLGISPEPASTEQNTPAENMTRTRYTDNTGMVMVEAIVEHDQGHSLIVMPDSAIAFLGLDDTASVGVKATIGRPTMRCRGVRIVRNSEYSFAVTVPPHAAHIECTLSRPDGKKVTSLSRRNHSPESGRFTWNWAKTGNRYTSGIYLLTVTVNGTPLGTTRFAFSP